MPTLRVGTIDEFTPASQNANKHTERGLYELEKSMQQDGFVAAMTVAANGEALDGSARMEKSAVVFGEDVTVIHHDGTRPIILVRDDIPDASAPIAKRIAIRANRIAQIDLNWDLTELLDTAKQVDLGKLWTAEEWNRLVCASQVPEQPEDSGSYSENSSQEKESDGITCPRCGFHIGGN
jgi:hypothetical protein